MRNAKDSGTAGCAGSIYFLGLLGAWYYYIDTADGFFDGLWGIFVAFFWPAVLVAEAFSALGV